MHIQPFLKVQVPNQDKKGVFQLYVPIQNAFIVQK